jgi:2,3-bisphosphoglycerate-independent phosphoglycerate mutase
MEKVFFVICDGLGDRPIEKFGRKTPLEAADTPNLDKLARKGISGMLHPVDIGVRPGSDVAHLSLFGYNLKTDYTGRGPFEAAGIGMDARPGDICLRVNAATVNKDSVVIDRRAGRIDDTSEISDLLDGTVIEGIRICLKPGTGHRMVLVMRGKNLDAAIADVDPHSVGIKVKACKAVKNNKKAKRTARVLQKFLTYAHKKLLVLDSNKERKRLGKFEANYLLSRGAGVYPNLPSFEEKYGLKAVCVAGAGLYKGIGRLLGMDVVEVEGATGKADSNIAAKVRKAISLKSKYDFFFIHFKGTDILGEDGDCEGKKQFIEKIDAALKPLVNMKDILLVATADHSTPCSLKAHSADDVPVVIASPRVRDDDVEKFGERACAHGRLGAIRGKHLMPIIIDLLGMAKLVGA